MCPIGAPRSRRRRRHTHEQVGHLYRACLDRDRVLRANRRLPYAARASTACVTAFAIPAKQTADCCRRVVCVTIAHVTSSRLLSGGFAAFPPGRYSAVAGFEPSLPAASNPRAFVEAPRDLSPAEDRHLRAAVLAVPAVTTWQTTPPDQAARSPHYACNILALPEVFFTWGRGSFLYPRGSFLLWE